MNCALIMAGGRGTRFWPMSTNDKPKQFLSLIDKKTMLQLTVERCLHKMPIENVFICTSQQYSILVQEQIPNLPIKNIIVEPLGRNTAPCVLLSCLYIKQIYEQANIMVLPSDHEINNLPKYFEILSEGMHYLSQHKGKGIITLGIKPTYPETGYGYIQFQEEAQAVKPVVQFVEKPNIEKAEEYIQKGCYLWNAGMFLFHVDYLLLLCKQYMKDTYTLLSQLPSYDDSSYLDALSQVYQQCEAISFDYAIAEKCNDMYVIESDIDWDDIGSWKALDRYLMKDKKGNISKGNAIFIASSNNVAYTSKKVIFKDVEDMICIESEHEIIITKVKNIEELHTYKDLNDGK